eukprot:3344297-Rhodomonas_salina.1
MLLRYAATVCPTAYSCCLLPPPPLPLPPPSPPPPPPAPAPAPAAHLGLGALDDFEAAVLEEPLGHEERGSAPGEPSSALVRHQRLRLLRSDRGRERLRVREKEKEGERWRSRGEKEEGEG